jgi:hypothetical protein
MSPFKRNEFSADEVEAMEKTMRPWEIFADAAL